jgi:hypothetical protein
MVLRAHSFAAAIATLALFGAAAGAHAQSAGAQAAPTASNNLGILTIDPNHWGAPPAHKSLQWDQKGRWGLKLDMNEPVGREMQLRDVQAGAYYRVTPSLRVGGAVSLSNQPVLPDHTAVPANAQGPQVKLETTFKF